MSKKLKKRTKVRLTVVMIFLLAFTLLLFDAPVIYDKSIDFANSKLGIEMPHFANVPFRLGLDLQGGTHLVYEADTEKVPTGEKGDALEGVRDVIERRVNAFGVSEPIVQVNKAKGKWRVIVELAGITDVREAIKMIGETPLLEFKEQNEEPPRELTPEERQDLEAFNKKAATDANEALKKVLAGDDFGQAAEDYTFGAFEANSDLGWITANGEYSYLFEKAELVEPGNIYPHLIEQENIYTILKVDDKRENGVEAKASHILICYTGASNCEAEYSKEGAQMKIDELKAEVTAENFAQLAKENSTGPSAPDGGDLGWFGPGQMVPEFDEAVFTMEVDAISEVVETQFGYHLINKTEERPIIEYDVAQVQIKKMVETEILPPQEPWKNTELTGKHLKNARVEFDPNTNFPEVALVFNDEGKDLFAEVTKRNVGKPVAIFLDGEPISVPRVNEQISGGEAIITGDFDIQEAKLLSQRLSAGALPVPIDLISQQTVGASLGADSLQKSLFAGIVGLILVALFMIIYYRLPGLLAVLALLIYGVIILFIFKAIPVTLTLAGIAGFILSVGMAVDANVLIFERLKEELRMGKPLGTAIDEGFKRAWTSIRDGNVSTLITCFILAWFGTSMIKGFAITLGIGVILSMFSAVVVTRQLLYMFVNPEKHDKRLWLFGIKKKSDQD